MRLLLPPNQSGYTVAFPEEVLRVQLEGGKSRYRQDILNGSSLVNVEWQLDPSEYSYLMAFYRSIAGRGAISFTCFLIVDESPLIERTCNFIPGSISLTRQQGLTYYVSAQLEVAAIVNPDELIDDTAIVDAYNASQGYSP